MKTNSGTAARSSSRMMPVAWKNARSNTRAPNEAKPNAKASTSKVKATGKPTKMAPIMTMSITRPSSASLLTPGVHALQELGDALHDQQERRQRHQRFQRPQRRQPRGVRGALAGAPGVPGGLRPGDEEQQQPGEEQ